MKFWISIPVKNQACGLSSIFKSIILTLGVIPGPRDECGEQIERWLSEFGWACNGRSSLNRFLKAGGDANIYYIEHNTPWPADANLSQNSGRRQCIGLKSLIVVI